MHRVVAMGAVGALLVGCGNTEWVSMAVRERACVTYQACVSRETDVQTCVGSPRLSLLPAEQLACLARAAGSCEAALACVGTRVDFDAVCFFEGRVSCEGDALVGCFGGDEFFAPHAFLSQCPGGGVRRLTTGGGVCVRPCVIGTTRCAGNTAWQCVTGEWSARDVCGVGTECVESDAGASCEPVGEPCVRATCEGDVLFESPRETATTGPAIDCRTWDVSCDLILGGAACGAASASGCARETHCEGDELLYCSALGHERRVDCAAAGFAGCSDTPFVSHCEPSGASIFTRPR